MRRLERESIARRIDLEHADPLSSIAPHLAEIELEAPTSLQDRPAWARDAVTISRRARELLARARPIFVRVLTFWDHLKRSVNVGDQRLAIDASGSYKLAR
ncbi:MAG TPA: hypothetical protein VMV73_03855 [Candidatus Dormibacteraeota bacterium]|nr:hypothetical protein [Candidatus Dormibacteraeota bacterium]